MFSATLRDWKRKIEQLRQRWRQQNERLRKEIERLRYEKEELERERERMQREQERMQHEQERMQRENERLQREQEQLQREQDRLQRERERLRKEIDNLKLQLEEAQRANKRQAAPFSRGHCKERPKTPGRKPGSAYGQRSSKQPPRHVDEVIDVPLPERCSCGGRVKFERTESQYQHEIVRKTIWRRFDIGIGHCEECQKRWQGRDPTRRSYLARIAGCRPAQPSQWDG
jgi:hypothetical protein